ncbi:MAG TPA: hypothetical protein VIL90_07905 [Puia sp.]|jgi:hypothetical protein
MPKFITSIRLQEATEKDYAVLSKEMKKNSFSPVNELKKNISGGLNSPFVFNSTSHKSLLDTTAVVSLAAATTGKKYSFTVIREKSKIES